MIIFCHHSQVRDVIHGCEARHERSSIQVLSEGVTEGGYFPLKLNMNEISK